MSSETGSIDVFLHEEGKNVETVANRTGKDEALKNLIQRDLCSNQYNILNAKEAEDGTIHVTGVHTVNPQNRDRPFSVSYSKSEFEREIQKHKPRGSDPNILVGAEEDGE